MWISSCCYIEEKELGVYKHTNSTCNYIRYEHQESEAFLVTDELRQGGILSSKLFITIMDDIIKEILLKTKQL